MWVDREIRFVLHVGTYITSSPKDLAEHFTVLKHPNTLISEFYLVQKHQPTDLEALKLRIVQSGRGTINRRHF